MSTSKEYLNHILDGLSLMEDIRHRAMMGEYLLYYKDKLIGGIYDNRLLLKPARILKSLVPEGTYEKPYDGAKEMFLVEETDDKELVAKLINAVYDELHAAKAKKK